MADRKDGDTRLVMAKTNAHVGMVGALEILTRSGDPDETEAIARGTINGITEWLVNNLGAHAAYDLLQTGADEVIMIAARAAGGTTNGEAAKQKPKGK